MKRPALGPLFGPAFALFCAFRFGDVVNAVTGIWLVPRYVPQDELGAVLPLAQVATALALPLSIVLTPYAKLLNVHAERGERGKVKAMVRDAALAAAIALAAALALVPVFMPAVFRAFGIQDGNLALAIVFSSMIGAVAPVFTETLRALRRFATVSWSSALAPPLRFAVMCVALPFRGLTGYFVGQAAAPAFQSAVAMWDFARRSRGVRRERWWSGDRADFLAYLLPLAVSSVSGNVRGLAESMTLALVPKIESAAWYQLTRFSEIAAYAGLSIVFVLFPVASARHERGDDTRPMLLRAMSLAFLAGAAISATLALAGPRLFASVGFLRPFASFTPWLLPLGLLASARTASACFTTHELACRRFRFLRYAVPIALVETLAVLLLCRGPFRPAWHLSGVFAVMAAGTLATLAGNVLDFLLSRPRQRFQIGRSPCRRPPDLESLRTRARR